eukprot:jgi/Botrbrau1/6369/Bobra.0098s0028.1
MPCSMLMDVWTCRQFCGSGVCNAGRSGGCLIPAANPPCSVVHSQIQASFNLRSHALEKELHPFLGLGWDILSPLIVLSGICIEPTLGGGLRCHQAGVPYSTRSRNGDAIRLMYPIPKTWRSPQVCSRAGDSGAGPEVHLFGGLVL